MKAVTAVITMRETGVVLIRYRKTVAAPSVGSYWADLLHTLKISHSDNFRLLRISHADKDLGELLVVVARGKRKHQLDPRFRA